MFFNQKTTKCTSYGGRPCINSTPPPRFFGFGQFRAVSGPPGTPPKPEKIGSRADFWPNPEKWVFFTFQGRPKVGPGGPVLGLLGRFTPRSENLSIWRRCIPPKVPKLGPPATILGGYTASRSTKVARSGCILQKCFARTRAVGTRAPRATFWPRCRVRPGAIPQGSGAEFATLFWGTEGGGVSCGGTYTFLGQPPCREGVSAWLQDVCP